MTTSTGQPSTCLQFDEQATQVEETAARLEVDEKVHVTVRSSLAPRHGPEDAHVVRSMTSGNVENDCSPLKFTA